MKSDVQTTFCPNFNFTVKAFMISNSLYKRNFQVKTDMNGKIGSYTKFCAQNKILDSKMRNLKQLKTSVFAPLILKRWIARLFSLKLFRNLRDRVTMSLFKLSLLCKYLIKRRTMVLWTAHSIFNYDSRNCKLTKVTRVSLDRNMRKF